MNFFKRLFNLKAGPNPQRDKIKNKNLEEKLFNIKHKVETYFAYLLTIYNDYVEQYNKNKAFRDMINKNTEPEAYIRNIDNGIHLTLKAIQRVESAPYVYDLPKSIQQYMSASKIQFILSLEHYVERDEIIKKILTNNQDSHTVTMDQADEVLAKADQHLHSAMNYMEKSKELLS